MNRIKKLSIIIFCCVILFVNSDDAEARIRKVVKIGYIENWGMIQEKHEINKPGYGYEYFEEIARYTGHKYEFVKIEWHEISQKLENGKIDLFGTIGLTEDRAKEFEYTKQPFGYEEILLTAPEGSDILFNDIEAMNNKSVSALENTTMLIDYLDEYLLEKDIRVDYKEYVRANALEQGKYDLEVIGSFFAYEDRKVVAKLGLVPLYFIAQKGNTDLIEKLDNAHEEIAYDNIFFELELNQKYFEHTKLAMHNLSKEDKLLLEEKDNSFTVFISSDHKPYLYVDELGTPRGIIIEIMELIADDAGITFKYVSDLTNPDYEDIDISINLLGEEVLRFDRISTNVYLSLPMMMIGTLSSGRDSTGTIGMLEYYAQNIEDKNVIRYDSIETMVDKINSGEIKYILSTEISISYILQEIGNDNSLIFPTDHSLDMVLKLSSEMSDYVEVFNKLIARLDQKEIEAITLKNGSAFLPKKTMLDMVLNNPEVSILLIVVGATIILGFFIITHRIKKKALYRIINEDEVTSLISIYRFHELAKERLKTAKPNEYMLISFDIDNFQYINETYGYNLGSKVLEALAFQLVEHYNKGTLITREKDDKFLILAINKKELKDGRSFCAKENCDDCISTCISKILGATYKTSRSQGLYIVCNPLETLEYMIDCAHSARALGKQNYGYTCFEFTEAMKDEKINKNRVVNTMEEALKNKEFRVFYQPKVELKGIEIIGAEALVRWFPKDGTLIFPDNFIPIFEKNGFILNLDYYVFEEVCIFICEWKGKLALPKISVNLSAITMLDENLIVKLTTITDKYNINNELLEIEITESAIVKDFDLAIIKIDQLKKAGFVISLDDFGSGQSSLNRLKDINIDILKIDREFLTANLKDAKGVFIIKSIIEMSKKLNILTIAEGVETKEHVAFLQELECDFAQGYYFGKPMKEEDFRNIISCN